MSQLDSRLDSLTVYKDANLSVYIYILYIRIYKYIGSVHLRKKHSEPIDDTPPVDHSVWWSFISLVCAGCGFRHLSQVSPAFHDC